MLASQFGARGRAQPTRPGNVIQDVINISPDGVFVATAIGYGFEEERGRGVAIELTETQTAAGFRFGDITLSQLHFDALIEGFRVNPRFERIFFETPERSTPAPSGGPLGRSFAADYRGELMQKVRAKREVSFLFSMVDSSSGRELQDEPTHNLASLGIGTGDRPFRPLAQPLSFLPRSTLRLQVEERSYETTGTLFIVLYGYRILAGAGCPEPVLRGPHATPVYPGGAAGFPPGASSP